MNDIHGHYTPLLIHYWQRTELIYYSYVIILNLMVNDTMLVHFIYPILKRELLPLAVFLFWYLNQGLNVQLDIQGLGDLSNLGGINITDDINEHGFISGLNGHNN